MTSTATIGAEHRPLRDKVVEELRRRIIDCDYAPGHRLTEDRLADDFGVSRNPVREAIRDPPPHRGWSLHWGMARLR